MSNLSNAHIEQYNNILDSLTDLCDRRICRWLIAISGSTPEWREYSGRAEKIMDIDEDSGTITFEFRPTDDYHGTHHYTMPMSLLDCSEIEFDAWARQKFSWYYENGRIKIEQAKNEQRAKELADLARLRAKYPDR